MLTALVVDDEAEARAEIADLLRLGGWQVREAVDVAAGVGSGEAGEHFAGKRQRHSAHPGDPQDPESDSGGEGRDISVLFGLGSLIFSVALIAFELFVAGLQAYVFTILSAVYIAGALEPEH